MNGSIMVWCVVCSGLAWVCGCVLSVVVWCVVVYDLSWSGVWLCVIRSGLGVWWCMICRGLVCGGV